MDTTKEKILELFQKKGCELPTSEIANYVYPVFSELKSKNNEESKREIAKLHRRLLHHINILLEEGLLRVSKHGEKGQKFFALNLEEGEEIISLSPKYKKRVSILKPLIPSLPIESYEEIGIVTKYQAERWVDKINSLCIDCNFFHSLEEIKNLILSSLEIANDSVCLINFEKYIRETKLEDLTSFIKDVNDASFSYNKTVNFFIELDKLKEEDNIISFFGFSINKYFDRIIFIFSINYQNFNENFSLSKKIFSFYVKEKKIINLLNNSLTKDILFIGKAGPYLVNKKDLENKKNLSVFVCSQSTILVDMERFYSSYGFNQQKFSELMLSISKSFLSANFLQRKRSEIYFKKITDFLGNKKREFLEFSKNYIRLWNFGLSQEKINSEIVLNIISESKKKIENFSIAEETIYKSCGMPIRFKLALSCAFEKSKERLSEAKYNRIIIYKLEDLYSSKLKQEIKKREQLLDLFNGGNDVTFHRFGAYELDEIIREISFILSTFRLGFFSYNLEGIKKDMKLNEFL